MIWALLLAASARAADFELPVTTLTPRIDFRADSVEYDESSRTLLLRGNAEFTDSTFSLRSSDIRLDLENRVFECPAPLEISDGDTAFSAAGGSFDLPRRDGRFQGLTGRVAPWRFSGRKAGYDGRRYHLKGAMFTSCDRDRPHYRIRASRLTLVPNVRMYSFNNVLFLGRVPFFYLPFFYRSLRPDPWAVTKFHLGFDGRNGTELQSDTRIRINSRAYNRLYVDYYSLQGWGFGDEVNYRHEDGSRGTVYGYRIQERGENNTRWAALGDLWRKLPGPYYLQGRLENQSDPDFNNAYFRSHQIRVSPEINNSVALVRQTNRTTTRVSYSRRDTRDPLAPTQFTRASESAPRVDFSAASFKVAGLPVLHNVTAFSDRSIDLSRDFYKNTGGGTWSMTNSLQLLRGLSFVPTVGLSEFYEDRVTGPLGTAVEVDRFTGRYFMQADLRARTPLGSTTLGHRYTRRLAPNAFHDDVTAADRGEEQNLLTGEHSVLRTTTRFAVASGYDLKREPRGALTGRTFKDRLQAVVGDAMWSPHYKWTFLARETWRYGVGHQSVLLAADYGFPGESRAGLSLSHNAFSPGRVQAGTTFGLVPERSSWTVEGALRWEARGEGDAGGLTVSTVRLFEKEVSVRKVWHDFITRLLVRERPGGVREFMVRVDMRIGDGGAEIRQQQWEQEFYPWRQGLQEK